MGAPESIAAPTVTVPAGINHAPWDVLLRKYVDDRGLVNYRAWKTDIGDMQSLVTQNIDALDEKAGLQNLIEIHGNRTKLRCIECGDRVSIGDFVPLYAPDPCKKCDGLVKFDTVMFGEPIPDDVMAAARSEIDKADCVLAIGTSATVRPASGLLWIAESLGATIIEINPTETKLTPISEVSLRSTAGEALPLLLQTLSN